MADEKIYVGSGTSKFDGNLIEKMLMLLVQGMEESVFDI